MIVDVFLFHDEFDMLRCRGYELDSVVDMHVAIEGNQTMSGHPREYRLKGDEIDNLEVIRVDLSDLSDVGYQSSRPYPDNWKRDRKQRDAADRIVKTLPDDAIVMYGDVDEIPKREAVAAFDKPSVYGMSQAALIYSTAWSVDKPWTGTVIGMKGALFPFGHSRDARHGFPSIPDAGWHLTWFGGEEAVLRKVQAFAHGEMAEDLHEVFHKYANRLRPADGTPLTPYDGPLPGWVRDGYAPPTWMER